MTMSVRIATARRCLIAGVSSYGTLLRIGRSLLILLAVLLSTSPLTQHLWTWDRFPYGGQDFETTALMVLVVLSLVLVLSKQSKKCVDLLFALWRFPEFKFDVADRDSSRILLHRALWAWKIEPMPSPALGIYTTPIQI